MKQRLDLIGMILVFALLSISADPIDPSRDKPTIVPAAQRIEDAKGMKQVPFEVINKSGQAISISLFRYKDDYPSKYYYFSLEEGSRKRPTSGSWEVWKGEYNLIVFGEDMGECYLPFDLDDQEAGIEIVIKGRFRLVVPPCQELFTNQGEASQLKYDWSNSFVYDPLTSQTVPYRNWFTILGDT